MDYYNNEVNEGHIYIDFSVENPISIKKGDKFCQGIIENFYIFKDEIEPLNKKRTGGMGSTGKQIWVTLSNPNLLYEEVILQWMKNKLCLKK